MTSKFKSIGAIAEEVDGNSTGSSNDEYKNETNVDDVDSE